MEWEKNKLQAELGVSKLKAEDLFRMNSTFLTMFDDGINKSGVSFINFSSLGNTLHNIVWMIR